MRRMLAQRSACPRSIAVPFPFRIGASLIGGVLLLAALTARAEPAGRSVSSPHDQAAAIRQPAAPPTIPENEAEILEIESGVRTVPIPESEPLPDVPRPLSPMMVEMMAVLERETAELSGLQDRFEKSTDADAALAVQREIEEVKRNTELSLLEIQARYARQNGRHDLAENIEAAIERIKNPVMPSASAAPSERRGASHDPSR